jgi:hypothetical protein
VGACCQGLRLAGCSQEDLVGNTQPCLHPRVYDRTTLLANHGGAAAPSWLNMALHPTGAAGVPQLTQQLLPLRALPRVSLQPQGITSSTLLASLVSVSGFAAPHSSGGSSSGGSLTQADHTAAAAELEALDQHLAKLGITGAPSTTPNGSHSGSTAAAGAAAAAERWAEVLCRSPLLMGAYGRSLGELLAEGQGPDQRSDSLDSLTSGSKPQ